MNFFYWPGARDLNRAGDRVRRELSRVRTFRTPARHIVPAVSLLARRPFAHRTLVAAYFPD